MNLFSRIHLIVKSKTLAAIEPLEDPRETLNYAYGEQQELRRQVKRGLIEVATARRQLEAQAKKLRERLPHLEGQAQRALAAGRDDLARLALQRKQTCLAELASLDKQLAEMAEEERKLTVAERQCALRVEAFGSRKDTLSARYTAAEAQVRVQESLSGLSGEFAELGLAVERAEKKVERMTARASAIDALLDAGSLIPFGSDDPLERELNEVAAGKAVDDELAALKAQVGSQDADERR